MVHLQDEPAPAQPVPAPVQLVPAPVQPAPAQGANQQAPIEPALIPPRLPCTHLDPELIQLLKQLPLYNKLEKNKHIKADNHRRRSDKVDHRTDPLAS